MHKIPAHVLAIASHGAVDRKLIELMVEQIDKENYIGALNTIETMHQLLGELRTKFSMHEARPATILRLHSIKKILKNITEKP